jgi:hypothetical protein
MSRTRRRAPADEGIALLLTVFLMLLVASMSLIIGTVVLMQVKPTQYEGKSTRTVNSAEAGFDVALNRIRAAQNAKGEGLRTQLPCTATAGTVLAGPVGPGTRDSTYSVKIRYYAADPTKQSESWRASTGNLIACQAGSPSTTPAYALLESTGTGAALPGTNNTATRVLEQTYRFQTSNANIPGGQIRNHDSGLCLAVDDHKPGERVRVRTCDSTGTNLRQKWAYTPELLLKTTDSAGEEYCVEGKAENGWEARLEKNNCTSDKAVYVWGYNAHQRFELAAAASDGSPSGGLSGWCLTVKNDKADGSLVVMRSSASDSNACNGSSSDPFDSQHSFAPDSTAGAGAAGAASQQLVNHQLFSRCIDVYRGGYGNDWYLIAYQCKQTPDPANISWNQKFFWDESTSQFCTRKVSSGTTYTVTSCTANVSDLYCLQAGITSTPASGTRVVAKLCSKTSELQKWTRRYKTQTSSSSYNILTKLGGLCLDVNPAGLKDSEVKNGELSDKQWGVIEVTTCNGSNRQKWNAPADFADPATINTYEHDR